VGCYVAVLNGSPQHVPRRIQGDGAIESSSGLPSTEASKRTWRKAAWIGVAVFLTAAIGLQVLLGTVSGISQARAWHQSQIVAADLTVNIDRAPQSLIYAALCEDLCFRYIGRDVHFVSTHHLSLFSTGAAVARYTRKGWLALAVSAFPLSTWVEKPVYGARLRGGQWLLAGNQLGGTGDGGASRIDMYVEGRALDRPIVLRAVSTPFGWLAGWNTRTVPDGPYTIRSRAYDSLGKGTWSGAVPVSVAN
jgi:hypothetical protein